MKSLHLTIMIFCHVLLASVVLYFTTYANASPLTAAGVSPPKPEAPTLSHLKTDPAALQPVQQQKQLVESKLDNKRSAESKPEAKSAPVEAKKQQPVVAPVSQAKQEPAKIVVEQYAAQKPEVVAQPKKPVVEQPQAKLEARNEPTKVVEKSPEPVKPVSESKQAVDVIPPLTERKMAEKNAPAVLEAPVVVSKRPEEQSKVESPLMPKMAPQPPVAKPEVVASEKPVESAQKKAPMSEMVMSGKSSAVEKMLVEPKEMLPAKEEKPAVEISAKMAEPVAEVANKIENPKLEFAPKKPEAAPLMSEPVPMVEQAAEKKPAPVVKGGLGPLHLLAATLCNYQPEKPVADETLNELYRRRAIVRKSLFEFMSLKFTNLEKLSSRLGDFGGLAVVPMKTVEQASKSSIVPSHGWPLVGKCTAHDLRLMGEAAWCDVEAAPQQVGIVSSSQEALKSPLPVVESPVAASRVGGARSMPADMVPQVAEKPVDQSAVISKILRAGDVRDAQTIESSIGNLNLTQQQLANIQAQAASTRECRRNALRYTKSIFNHLAEDQKNVSESWPKLYALISEDECARKRMIDIITALSGFRSDTTSVRRDNLEFAFAMDDLRGKVLENEVNVPLTFDKQFIEVEQFLQQSVQLMLANIDPERAKITSARYRSLMSGPTAADDQCIELHQRLMARNYPTDCNPTQFGQLPDVLRMTAHSLELWSIEKELGQRSSKLVECTNYQANRLQQAQQQTQPQALVNPVLPQQPVVNKESVDECIASLVTS